MELAKNTLEIAEIKALLPHRYPMLLVDRVLDYQPMKSLHAIKNVSINEPVFNGHFPELPIFPGVMILEALAQATGILGFKSTNGRDENEMYLFAGILEKKSKLRKYFEVENNLNIVPCYQDNEISLKKIILTYN